MKTPSKGSVLLDVTYLKNFIGNLRQIEFAKQVAGDVLVLESVSTDLNRILNGKKSRCRIEVFERMVLIGADPKLLAPNQLHRSKSHLLKELLYAQFLSTEKIDFTITREMMQIIHDTL